MTQPSSRVLRSMQPLPGQIFHEYLSRWHSLKIRVDEDAFDFTGKVRFLLWCVFWKRYTAHVSTCFRSRPRSPRRCMRHFAIHCHRCFLFARCWLRRRSRCCLQNSEVSVAGESRWRITFDSEESDEACRLKRRPKNGWKPWESSLVPCGRTSLEWRKNQPLRYSGV